MSNTKRKPRKEPSNVGVSTRLRFENGEEMALVKAAAQRRGLGYNAFMRLICVGAAKRVMKSLPEAVLGQFADSAVNDLG